MFSDMFKDIKVWEWICWADNLWESNM